MATRKIKLTLSGMVYDSAGPVVDIDFNGVSQDADHEVTAVFETNNEIREYTVDVAAGTYNLEIEYKNDIKEDGSAAGVNDRNLVIEKVEIANDGTNYSGVYVNEDSASNIYLVGSLQDGRWRSDKINGGDKVANPAYDSSQPRTDDTDGDYVAGTHEGSNAMWQYADQFGKHKMFTNGTGTIQLTFT